MPAACRYAGSDDAIFFVGKWRGLNFADLHLAIALGGDLRHQLTHAIGMGANSGILRANIA